MILHDIDVPNALIDFTATNSIGNIVVGASSRNAITRKFRNTDVASSLLKFTPESCAVYVISKGKVQTVRQAGRPQTPTGIGASPGQRSQRGLPPNTHDPEDTQRASIGRRSWRSTGSDRSSSDSFQMTPPNNVGSSSRVNSPVLSFDSFISENSSQGNSESSLRSNSSENLEFSSESPRASGSRVLEVEMKRLRLELKQTMDMYNSACKEAVSARHRAKELQHWKTEEERRFEQAKLAEEAALALAEVERHRTKTAMEAAQMQQRLAEMESQKRKSVEMKAKQEAAERKKAMAALAHGLIKYRRYTIEEIEVATDHFNTSLKIGEGGYGPVYKGWLDHTPVAIKILRPDLSQGQKQFQQEVEVLSCMRHPHMVLLLGACPEYGCLVYEFMDNGSLEDRLFRKDNTPPISWESRFRIAAEIATALLFLHQTKPEPLVHRDLKPANILLNQTYLSKISDVGLARLVPPSLADTVTQYHMTAAAGTFCYIDPEYQQTGLLGVKSDIYSLGVILLQVITARPPIGLSHHVEEAIKGGTFAEILDPTVTDWPVEEAMSLAKIALKCCELRKRDRPSLASVLLPELNRLRDLGLVHATAKNPSILDVPRRYSSDPEVGSTVDQERSNDSNEEITLECRSL